MKLRCDVVIAGTGVGGLFCALNLPRDKDIIIITKKSTEDCDSYLAQGGICVLKNEADYESYFEDTMRAGHYENNKEAVDIMIRSSREIIDDLIDLDVEFERDTDGNLLYTREGAHSTPRILFHEDITGKEITSKLLERIKRLPNVKIIENFTMVDLAVKDGKCAGIIGMHRNGVISGIEAKHTVLATGGIGGLYKQSTNYRHLTGDALAIAIKHGIELQNIDYIQIHPTTLYSRREGRRFLISESVRGEGALLFNAKMERFVDELLPRDIVTQAVLKQMKEDDRPYVWLSMKPIPKEKILSHFPNIYERCLEEGYDVTKECIPVVPAQHYFMGGVKIDGYARTSMDRLYAVGETACSGVHGKNRLASNSLLESLVFAKRAAGDIAAKTSDFIGFEAEKKNYKGFSEEYKKLVLEEIEKEKKRHG